MTDIIHCPKPAIHQVPLRNTLRIVNFLESTNSTPSITSSMKHHYINSTKNISTTNNFYTSSRENLLQPHQTIPVRHGSIRVARLRPFNPKLNSCAAVKPDKLLFLLVYE
jgi:hypothetical protein